MQIISLSIAEGKKLFRQREVYIALLLCTALMLFGIRQTTSLTGESFLFWRELINQMPFIGYLFIGIMVIVGVSRCLSFEREQRMDDLLKSYKNGRMQLLIAKQLSILLYCATIVLYFYGVATLMLASIYDTKGLLNTVGKIEQLGYLYVTMNPAWTIGQLILFEISYLIIVSTIFGYFILLLSLLIKRGVFVMMLGGGLFFGLELFDKMIGKYVGQYEWSNLIPQLYRYGFNGMLNFNYVNWPINLTAIQSYFVLSIVFMLFFIVNLVVGRLRTYADMGV